MAYSNMRKPSQDGWGWDGGDTEKRQRPDHMEPCFVLLGLWPALSRLALPSVSSLFPVLTQDIAGTAVSAFGSLLPGGVP